jgi:hypothetical protein
MQLLEHAEYPPISDPGNLAPEWIGLDGKYAIVGSDAFAGRVVVMCFLLDRSSDARAILEALAAHPMMTEPDVIQCCYSADHRRHFIQATPAMHRRAG